MDMSIENKVPFFSVIVPVYNVYNYLERCMKSVLNQNFDSYEVIVVDDGSTDGSNILCDMYATKYNHIKVIHKSNGGLASARNMGLDEAKGEYVLWIDSDDWIDESSLSVLHSSIVDVTKENFQVDVVKFNYYRHVKENTPCYSSAEPGLYLGEHKVEILLKNALYNAGKYGLSACMHVYRRELLVKNKLRFVSEQEVGSEDYLFNIEVLLCAENIVVLECPLYYYDLREGSLTQQYREKLANQYANLYKTLSDYCIQNDKCKYQEDINRFFIWSLIHNTCFIHEYTVMNGHSIIEGRKKMKYILRMKEIEQAIKKINRESFTKGEKIQLWAMKLKIEPIFYYLFVLKSKSMRSKK